MATPRMSIRLGVDGKDKAVREMRELGTQGQRALRRIERAAIPASRSLLALNAATGQVRAGISGFAAGLGPAGAALMALGPAGVVAGGALAVITLGFKKALDVAGRAVEEFDKVAKAADKIGVTTDALQELRFAARMVGVEQRSMDTALQRFSRRLGEAANGTGVLSKVLDQYNIKIRDERGQLRSVTDVLKDYADAVKNASSAQEQLRMTVAAFDMEQASLVNLLRGGGDALDEFAQKARDLGLVVDESVLRKSEQMSDELAIAGEVIRTNLNQAFVDLGPTIVYITGLVATLARAIASVVDYFRGIESKSISGLSAALPGMRKALEQEASAYNEISSQLESARKVMDSGNNFAKSMARFSVKGLEDAAASSKKRLNELNSELLTASKRIQDFQNRASKPFKPPSQLTLPKSPRAPAPVRRGGGGGGMSERNRQLALSKKIIEETLSPLERYNAEVAELNSVRHLLTAEQYARALDKIKVKYEQAAQASRGHSEAMKQSRQMAQAFSKLFVDGLEKVILKGESVKDVLRGIGRSITQMLLRAALNPLQKMLGSALSGVMGGLFGGMTGGGLFGSARGNIFNAGQLVPFAAGGVLSGGSVTRFARGGIVDSPILFPMRNSSLTGLMGEAGPEAIMPLARDAQGRLGVRGGGQGDNITINFHVQASDAQSFRKSETQITAMVARAARRGSRNL